MILCKVGGSLLDWPEFPDRLRDFLDQLNAPVVLLTGGGSCADLVRQWDHIFNLEEERSHRLAIGTMSLTASLVTSVLAKSCLVKNQQQLEMAIVQQLTPVLDAVSWVDQLEMAAKIKLRHHWNITSDSVALWLAAELGIEHLFLLKSVDFPDGLNIQAASDEGVIDAGFPEMFLQISCKREAVNLHWHNLRGKRGLVVDIE